MSPFDLNGGQFLALYAMLLAIAVVLSLVIPGRLRPEGRDTLPRDPDELAYLVGGGARYTDTVMSRLMAQGDIVLEGDKVRIVHSATGRAEPDKSILQLSSPASVAKVFPAITKHARAVDERLIQSGLLIDAGTSRRIRYLAALPLIALIAFGSIKYMVGVGRDRPVGFLIALLVVTLIVAVIRFSVLDRKTRGAKRALGDMRGRSDRLRRAPTGAEMPVAVALFGTAVLAGSEFAPYHQLRAASSGGDGGGTDSGSSDSGGSGCGGGGCGGCGGS